MAHIENKFDKISAHITKLCKINDQIMVAREGRKLTDEEKEYIRYGVIEGMKLQQSLDIESERLERLEALKATS